MGLGKAAGVRAAKAGLCLTLLGGLLPGAARAQESPGTDESPPARKASLELSGSIGLLTPLSSLASTDVQAVDTAIVVRTDLSSTVAFVAELDYFFPNGFGIGVQAAYSGPDVTAQVVDTTAVPPAFLSIGTADYWAVSGNVMYRPHLTGPASQVIPYGAIGAGIRSLSFSQNGTLELANSTDFMGTAALGAVVELATWIGLRGELRYNLSSYKSALTGDSNLQNDIVVSVGATAKLID
jgi:hypothetical protein